MARKRKVERNSQNSRGYRQDPYQGQYNQPPYNQGQYGQDSYNQYSQGAYGQENYYEQQPNVAAKAKKRRTRRRVLFAVEVLILLILAVGIYVASKLDKVQKKDVSEDDIIINEEISSEEAEVLSGYTNIALYGIDSREGKLDIEAHSDTLMIASINNKTKEIKLVSVYRDTYLDNTNGEYRKATECYYFGGPERSMNMLNKNLDLNIKDFVTVDFGVLADVVDELGGIEIDVQEDELTHLNNYQVEGSQVTGKEIVTVESAGLQTLNGLQTLSYCRIRYTEGNDFKRSERQRTVLEKIIAKAKTTDLLTLNSIIDKVAPDLLTSLSTAEILSLAKDVASYDMGETTGFPFDYQTANISAGDCVVPVNLSNNVLQLHQWMFGSNGYTPSSTVQEISNTIINNTGIQ